LRPELEDILQHHGIKGMHWGKHKRKEVAPEVAKAKAEVAKRKENFKVANKAYQKSGMIVSQETTKNLASATRELKYAKQDLSSTKILNKINSKPKTAYQLKMEEKYKKQGMSNDEAAVAAYKNIRFKKIAAAAAITTLAVAGTYAGVKVRNARVDKIIKSGTTLQHITSESDKGIRDAFYSAKHGLDKSKYTGLYGGHIKEQTGNAFKKEIKVLTDIKQASPKNAQKILADLVKNDPEFAKGVQEQVFKNNKLSGAIYAKKITRSTGTLTKGVVNKDVYEVFNASLVDHSPEMQKLTDKYFKALSEKGYNAIKDVNDAKYSGYKSLNPIISFNSKGKVAVTDVKELAQNEINKHATIGYTHIIGSEIVKKGAATAAALTGVNSLGNHLVNKRNDKKVADYRRINPNTKLTNTEIIRMLERGA
jgi:hypothetical protein